MFARKIRFLLATFNKDKNYYQILGIKTGSTSDQIKRVYRELAKKYHPDVNKGNQDMFKSINQAYQVLSNQSTRNEYDSSRITQNPYTNSRTNYTGTGQSNKYDKMNESNRWGPLSPQEQEMLQMMRRNQEQFMRQYQQQFRNSQQYKGYTSYQQQMEDQYIRMYYENAHKRQRQRGQGRERRNAYQRDYYNQQFDRSKDSLFTWVGDAIKVLWSMWKDSKNKK